MKYIKLFEKSIGCMNFIEEYYKKNRLINYPW